MSKKVIRHTMNRGYGDAGASTTKRSFKGFTASSAGAIEDIDSNNYNLRQRARMLYMASPIATSAVKTNRTNTIGVGLQLNPKVDQAILGITPQKAEEWQRNTRAEFALWADDKNACDAIGMNDFYSLQQLAFTSWLVSGDCFILRKDYGVTPRLPYGLRLHVIEADRISTPTPGMRTNMMWTEGTNPKTGNRIHDGVEVDSQGKAVAYHICNHYPYSLVNIDEPTEWIRVETYGERTGLPNIMHIMSSERPDQYRGVSYLAQIIEPLLQIRRYTESEVMAALIESFYTVFIKTELDASENPYNEAIPADGDEASYDPNEYEMGPGQINVMNPGESIDHADPKRPNSGFDAFVEAICKQIGAALEIPKELLLKEFTASYSASRAAMLEAWKAFRMYRKWFTSDFCEPVYELWLSEAVARGRIQAPGFFSDPKIKKAWLKAEWVGPSQGQLDPVKEITAEIMAVQAGFTTNEDAAIRLNGSSWTSNMDQLEREEKKKASVFSPDDKTQATINNTIRESFKEVKDGNEVK